MFWPSLIGPWCLLQCKDEEKHSTRCKGRTLMLAPGVAVQLSSFAASDSGHVAGEQPLVWVVGEGEGGRVAQPKVGLR